MLHVVDNILNDINTVYKKFMVSVENHKWSLVHWAAMRHLRVRQLCNVWSIDLNQGKYEKDHHKREREIFCGHSASGYCKFWTFLVIFFCLIKHHWIYHCSLPLFITIIMLHLVNHTISHCCKCQLLLNLTMAFPKFHHLPLCYCGHCFIYSTLFAAREASPWVGLMQAKAANGGLKLNILPMPCSYSIKLFDL